MQGQILTPRVSPVDMAFGGRFCGPEMRVPFLVSSAYPRNFCFKLWPERKNLVCGTGAGDGCVDKGEVGSLEKGLLHFSATPRILHRSSSSCIVR